MKRANRAAGAECFSAVPRNYYRGTVVALDDPRRGDADDTAVPALSVDDDAVGVEKCGIAGEAFFHGTQDSPLFLLAVGVEMIEFRGEFAGSGRIFHAEEFDHVAGHVHAAGGVDSRSDAEAYFAGRGRTLGGNLRDFEQGLEPGIHRAA